ncbi:MAG: anti-sigma factor [Verrucomicrobiota bacterium]
MIRFEELSAGRAMGDLTHEEERELIVLGEQLGIDPDPAFELLAASIEVDFVRDSLEPLPAGLAARLHRRAADLEKPASVIEPRAGSWQKILRSPLTGWAAAAAIAVIAVLGSQKAPRISPFQAEAKLRAEARDLIERSFSGLGAFKDAGGRVIWSDRLQQGFMTLSGIPVNDPKKSQYQLWIVDPKRDEAPVDGGVFDIPVDGSPVLIPIAAKLALTNPQAFVITLEQPGGVVKSKQEHVVALAKN